MIKKTGKNKKLDTAYQLKITLNDSSPKVWRRIVVPAAYSFFDLHCAIQNAMGWSDSHLHGFYIAQKGTARPIVIQFPNPENDFSEDDLDERKEKISDYFDISVRQCKYTYDFGDNWDHTILFEREVGLDQGEKYPQCVAGENACPSDDCGGVWGYRDLQKIVRNPKHKEHKDILEWLCLDKAEDFDPKEFVANDVYFENPKSRLRDYEKGFGVKPLGKD